MSVWAHVSLRWDMEDWLWSLERGFVMLSESSLSLKTFTTMDIERKIFCPRHRIPPYGFPVSHQMYSCGTRALSQEQQWWLFQQQGLSRPCSCLPVAIKYWHITPQLKPNRIWQCKMSGDLIHRKALLVRWDTILPTNGCALYTVVEIAKQERQASLIPWSWMYNMSMWTDVGSSFDHSFVAEKFPAPALWFT